MKRSSAQSHISQSRQQLRLGASGRMNYDSTGCETPPSRRRCSIDEISENPVELIVPDRDDYCIRVADRGGELAARCRNR